jgi:PadR family transcriptional regulator AphA
VKAHLETHEKALKAYGTLAKTLRKDEANDPQLPYWLITLNMGRHRTAAIVTWCKETLKELEEIERRQKGGK